MRKQELVSPEKMRSASSSKGTMPGIGGFPTDLLQGIAALVIGSAFLIGLPLTFLLGRLGESDPSPVSTIIIVACVALSLLFFALVRSGKFDPPILINIGLTYEVLIAFGLSFREGTQSVGLDGPVWGISWVCVLIVLFPFLVPTSTGKTFLTAFMAASMGPLAYVILFAVGDETPAFFRFIRLYLPNYIAAGLAVAPSIVINRLGRDLKTARELGVYRLEERLGWGGVGEVWRAEHRMLARPVAIKRVRPEALGGKIGESQGIVLERFQREAQATASLRSPHTIELYDFGISDDGTFYYVMELLDGMDIESFVQRFGPVPAERGIHFLGQVCHSLAEAHEKGLIHRDIKPANVCVCRYGREVDFIKVLDFGLVKPRGKSGGDDLKLTAENVATGTPAYMAPEQVLGDRLIDARADIYAVGCLGYWLLTGQLVFDGETAMKTMMDHVKTSPVPPSERSELGISASLDDVILSCLEKDPDRRPQSADALVKLLDACVTEKSWTPDRARRWWDIHKPGSAPAAPLPGHNGRGEGEEMKVERNDSGEVTILRLEGRLIGGPNANQFQMMVKDLLAEGRQKLLVDMRKVSWANSAGLGILFSDYTKVKNNGGTLKLVNVNKRVDHILTVTKLNTIFECYEDESSALASF